MLPARQSRVYPSFPVRAASEAFASRCGLCSCSRRNSAGKVRRATESWRVCVRFSGAQDDSEQERILVTGAHGASAHALRPTGNGRVPAAHPVTGRGTATSPLTPLPATEPLETALALGRRSLLARQREDGHWVGELQGDTILESEWVLLLAFLGRENDPRVRKAANYLLAHQLADGGWNNYPGGPSELSVSVKAYFALKLAGHDAEAPHMIRARQTILR